MQHPAADVDADGRVRGEHLRGTHELLPGVAVWQPLDDVRRGRGLPLEDKDQVDVGPQHLAEVVGRGRRLRHDDDSQPHGPPVRQHLRHQKIAVLCLRQAVVDDQQGWWPKAPVVCGCQAQPLHQLAS